MKKLLSRTLLTAIVLVMATQFILLPQSSSAASTSVYTVKPGDTLWKIAVKYEVGLSELIAANPKLANPNLIYPNQSLQIPQVNSNQAWENQVVSLVNVERQKAGLKPLSSDWQLARVARYKSEDMRDKNYFSHQSPTYGSPFDMIHNFGISYRYAGENIAAGQTSPQAVVNAWMNSAGHRANILNPNYTKIGVGLAKGGSYTYYWTQTFTG